MEQLFLIGAVACLVVSWIYIFLLKTKVRDCMTYIHNRIDAANHGLERRLSGTEGERDSLPIGSAWRFGMEDATRRTQGKATMNGKPKLIVGGSNSPQPLHYLCSHCLRPFFLPGNQPPKEAVAELLQRFGEHVEREHPGPTPDSDAPPVEADNRDIH